jgi:hypothetical protein
MSQLSGQRTRWLAVLAGLAQLSLVWACSATLPSSRKYVGPSLGPEGPADIESSLPDLWERWTVHLGPDRRAGGPLLLGNPLAMGGGRGGPGGEFPLQITATLMDTTLIEAGLKHYAALVKMTPEEETEFRRAYSQRYDVENHLLIWCELSTTWAELHLDLDRWTIFIEDDAVNQYEPLQILEEPQPVRQAVERRLPGFRAEQRRTRWEVRQKSLMLCFPRRDFYENPILSKKVESLKLVFQLNDDENTRAEGTWVFKK